MNGWTIVEQRCALCMETGCKVGVAARIKHRWRCNSGARGVVQAAAVQHISESQLLSRMPDSLQQQPHVSPLSMQHIYVQHLCTPVAVGTHVSGLVSTRRAAGATPIKHQYQSSMLHVKAVAI